MGSLKLFVTISILAILVAGIGALTSCSSSDGAEELLIYSPHGSDIQYEFTRGFEEWHLKKYGRAVKVKFIEAGGTETIIKRLTAQRSSHVAPDADMMFGGGSATFDNLGREGFLEAVNPPLPPEVAARLPKDIQGVAMQRTLSQLLPPSTAPATSASIAATHSADERPIWYAATASYFGIVVNKQRAAELGIPIPKAWEDIGGPKWFGNLSVADASKSSSIKSCLEMMLQQYGWEKGWPLIVKMYANAESVKPSGSQPADETSSAAAAGGIVIDFFGRIAVVKCGPSIAQFIVPEGGARLDPDPIAVLAGARHREVAAHMMEFVLSPEGQRLWTHRAGTPAGPAKKALGRMALLRELYENEGNLMTDPFNPFTANADLKIDTIIQRDRTVVLGDLIKFALVDNHDGLVVARRAVLQAGDPPELLALFNSLPFQASELPDLAHRYRPMKVNGVLEDAAITEARVKGIRDGWSDTFKQEIAEITAKAKAYKPAAP